MKTYELLAWSSVTAFDKPFYFEFVAPSYDSAMAKFREVSESEEYAWRKLRLDRIETWEDRMERLAALHS
jgi:hypothetical protein